LSALLTCGTRSVIDVVFDPITVGELDQARRLAGNLKAGMLLPADRNHAAPTYSRLSPQPAPTIGTIGDAVLNHLLPDRRIRVKARMIKRSNPNTKPAAPPSTAAATTPPSASTSSPGLDPSTHALTERRCPASPAPSWRALSRGERPHGHLLPSRTAGAGGNRTRWALCSVRAAR
jgi:hypothetical protein